MRQGRSAIVFAALTVYLGSPSTGASQTRANASEQRSPSEMRLRAHVEFLASEELGGRHSFAPSSDIAARYLATRLAEYGFAGGVPGGGYLQPVPLDSGKVRMEATYLVLRAGAAADTFRYEADYMLETHHETPARVETSVVFAGYGISAPRLGHDDFVGLDVEGKYVVTTNGRPEALADAALEPGEAGLAALQARGASGLIIISEGLLSNYAQFSSGYAERRVVYIREPDPTPDFQVIQAGPRLVTSLARLLDLPEERLIRPNGRALPPRQSLANMSLRTELDGTPMRATHNVIGVLEGSDPDLRDEYVVLMAHFDTVVGEAEQVFNGADDNTSGTAAVLEVARSLAGGPTLARSVLVAFVTAEELGLLGSEWIADHAPPVPLDKIVLLLDADMIGRSRTPADTTRATRTLTGPDEVHLLAPEPTRSRAVEISRQVDADLRMSDHYKTSDFMFQRSDNWTFHQRGVPTLFYFTGFHAEYHQPTDDPGTLDYGKLTRITRVIGEVARRWAN